VRLVGIDYLSVDPADSASMPAHKSLLGNGIWIVEGVNLDGVRPGRYDLVCLPLRIAHGDGSPCRALIRKRRQEPLPNRIRPSSSKSADGRD
jgi:arylformamidase